MSADILDEIDDVLTNWHGSVDSMHWVAPWDEPIVVGPRSQLRILTDVEGLDGYAAQAYLQWQARSIAQIAPQLRQMGAAFEQFKVIAEQANESLWRALNPLRQIVQQPPVPVAGSPMQRALDAKRQRGAPPGAVVVTQARRPRDT